MRRSQRGLHVRTQRVPGASLFVEEVRSLDACAGLCVLQDCAFYDFFANNGSCRLCLRRIIDGDPTVGALDYAPSGDDVVTGIGPNICPPLAEPYEAHMLYELGTLGAPFVTTARACVEWCLVEYSCGYYSWSHEQRVCTLGATRGLGGHGRHGRAELTLFGKEDSGVHGNVTASGLVSCESPSLGAARREWAAV